MQFDGRERGSRHFSTGLKRFSRRVDMDHQPRTIEGILGPGGLLARNLPGFEFRRVQLEMALLIEEALQKNLPVIVEAGTGTGKTFGYLTPLILSGRKAVISTGTKNLQEQIFLRDLPLLLDSTGLRAEAVMMKGRKNYLCLHRYHQRFMQSSLLPPEASDIRGRLETWIRKTQFGDREELPWLADQDTLWDSLSAGSDQCLGSECLFLDRCFLGRLRSRAAESRLIIVNHHLFFADMKVKEGGFGEIIPRFETVVFDEAHHVEEVATGTFGERLATAQILEWAADLEAAVGASRQRPPANFLLFLQKLRAAVGDIERALEPLNDRERLAPELLAGLKTGPGLEIRKCLQSIRQEETLLATEAGGIEPLLLRAREIERLVTETLEPREAGWLNWFEKRRRGILFYASPLDVSKALEGRLYQKCPRVVLTSATLTAGGNFDYVGARLGLPGNALKGIFPSHFDFKRQALLYVPTDLPTPNHPRFSEAAAERILQILQLSEGRALVLFTSYQNLFSVHRHLQNKLPFTLLKQGDTPRSTLLETFREDVHSVLLATGSFWQGVDVPGEALSCLVIDKLPFSSPGDPLVAARIDLLQEQGKNAFMSYQVPEAILALKQGLGRLIRKNTDRGVMAILDVRLKNARYGEAFVESLPPVPVTGRMEDIADFFGQTAAKGKNLSGFTAIETDKLHLVSKKG